MFKFCTVVFFKVMFLALVRCFNVTRTNYIYTNCSRVGTQCKKASGMTSIELNSNICLHINKDLGMNREGQKYDDLQISANSYKDKVMLHLGACEN